MSHNIEGFIAPLSALTRSAQPDTDIHVVPLGQGVAFVPADETFKRHFAAETGPPSVYPYFDALSSTADRFARALSEETPVAYVMTDYYGGAGAQASIVWRDGAVVLGPLQTGDQV